MDVMKKYHKVLTIAGSDSGGGAGVQADIKTISACGCYATSAITAITAQNTYQVRNIFPVHPESVQQQIEAVLDDIGTNSIKIGMLCNADIIRTVCTTLQNYRIKNIVLDPVMISTSGSKLLEDDAVEILTKTLIPMARILTPNIPEAEHLLGRPIKHQSDFEQVAQELGQQFKVSVLLKAGHLENSELIDVFYNQEQNSCIKLSTKRIETKNTHGTGCTLSSAIASYLALGNTLDDAVRLAKTYINQAIIKGVDYKIGQGHGPVKHFHNLWKS